MAESELAKKLREYFTDQPAESFEPLTFRELEIGDMYIALPLPGDNEGHGGFKGAHYIFRKIGPVQRGINLPTYNAERINDKQLSSFPDLTHVIKVE